MLYKIYKKLLKHFGPQGWWPINGVYDPEKKHFSEKEKFEIMAGALLTQNTAWNNVEKALSNLKKENLVDANKISKINLKKLQALIKPSGYYRQKAKRIKDFAKTIKVIGNADNIPRDRWLEIKGIGPETADSILLYVFGKPFFVVDAYTKRLVTRLGVLKSEDYRKVQKLFENSIPQNVEIYKEYHALIVALAKKYCKSKPECDICPILKYCHRLH